MCWFLIYWFDHVYGLISVSNGSGLFKRSSDEVLPYFNGLQGILYSPLCRLRKQKFYILRHNFVIFWMYISYIFTLSLPLTRFSNIYNTMLPHIVCSDPHPTGYSGGLRALWKCWPLCFPCYWSVGKVLRTTKLSTRLEMAKVNSSAGIVTWPAAGLVRHTLL